MKVSKIDMVGGTDKQKEYAKIIRERVFNYNLTGDFLRGFDNMKEDIEKYSKGSTYEDKIIYILEYAAKIKNNTKFWINHKHPYSVVKVTLKDLKNDIEYLNKVGAYHLPTLKGNGATAATNFRKKLIALEIDREYIHSLDHIQFNNLQKKALYYSDKVDKSEMFDKMIDCAEKIRKDFIENERTPHIWALNYNDNFRFLLSGRKLTKNSNPKLLKKARKKQRDISKSI